MSEKKIIIPEKLKVALIGLIIIGFLVLFYTCLWGTIENSSFYRYCEAGIIKFTGDYQNAAKIYDELGDYRLSEEKSYKIHHMLGEEHIENQEYQSALEEFKMAGAKDLEYYQYALAMYCLENGSYEAALEQFIQTGAYDSKDRIDECTFHAALESLKECKVDECLNYLDKLPKNYSASGLSVKKIRYFILNNKKWLSYGKSWVIDSGIVGAYEAGEDDCKGWELKISEAENVSNTFLAIENKIDDKLNLTMTITASFPYYLAYSRSQELQPVFATVKEVKKVIPASKLSDQIVFDANTNLLLGENSGTLRYHSEEVQILPEEDADEQVMAVKETTITFK